MYVDTRISCCGIREISGLSLHNTGKEAMQAFVRQTLNAHHTNFRYAIFSEALYESYRSPYGRNFATYLKAHKLGKVVATTWNVNPNSGNKLKAWLWTIDWDAARAWAKKNKPRVSKPRKAVTVPPQFVGEQVAVAING